MYTVDNSDVFAAGICYGFKVMITHESPNVPFTILKTRFREGCFEKRLRSIIKLYVTDKLREEAILVKSTK